MAVSLTGQVRVNLADSARNGCIYPWIGEKLETPDLPLCHRDLFQYVTKAVFA
jgi:hypothetical protein